MPDNKDIIDAAVVVVVDPTAMVHATVELEPGAAVGAGTRIWRGAHIRAGAVIGADCNIGANVFVDADVRVGDRVKVQNNVSVYAGVELADESFVGPAAVFTNDRNPRATGDWQLSATMVARGASVGANATVICGVTLEEHCLVGAGAVVTRSVAAHQLVLGNPARPAGWVCRCGEVVSRETTPTGRSRLRELRPSVARPRSPPRRAAGPWALARAGSSAAIPRFPP